MDHYSDDSETDQLILICSGIELRRYNNNNVCLSSGPTIDFESGTLHSDVILRFLCVLHGNARDSPSSPGPCPQIHLPIHQVRALASVPR